MGFVGFSRTIEMVFFYFYGKRVKFAIYLLEFPLVCWDLLVVLFALVKYLMYHLISWINGSFQALGRLQVC